MLIVPVLWFRSNLVLFLKEILTILLILYFRNSSLLKESWRRQDSDVEKGNLLFQLSQRTVKSQGSMHCLLIGRRGRGILWKIKFEKYHRNERKVKNCGKIREKSINKSKKFIWMMIHMMCDVTSRATYKHFEEGIFIALVIIYILFYYLR